MDKGGHFLFEHFNNLIIDSSLATLPFHPRLYSLKIPRVIKNSSQGSKN